MLRRFLTDNRREVITRCLDNAARRSSGDANAVALEHGIPVFLEQLIDSLRPARASALPAMEQSAARHGEELFRQDFAIGQVVHSYGDLCRAIMELAVEKGAGINVAEFGLLNDALDNAIADAVTEYCRRSSALVADRGLRAENERLGLLAHEMRNHVHTATLALAAVKAGNVGLGGATGAILDRTMTNLRNLVDRSLMEVRSRAPRARPPAVLPLDGFIRKAAAAAALEAGATGCELRVDDVDSHLAVRGHEDELMSALGNLLQNAFKFSHEHGEVSLHAYARGERVLIEVADSCGGLPPGMADDIFRPFVQASDNRTGLGLGLAIVKRSIEANEGAISVRDAPPVGCVFSIDLPRHACEA
ncbi:MAG: sensor histidine kinase [Betaproteobacteria bacterium]